ncbi:outer membrane lipoprotein carrier protein LolA [Sphingomonas piscis]|uniref:Outer membrane lipoprotein carrier protein LolA n=1 Tax=Sphingomonas piscis TaxID=2714943 RepID=A0A6G7YPN1_9SPHN|nr:outer-membrane lipoprotein carrier protein LolA [Sphingomonas piscis]QIK78686.1 outer membrane lipoprotein carrier protein LolA [Sphingomonas piscis]
MTYATNFARALTPLAIVAAAAPAAAQNADLAKVQAHLRAVDSMSANFTQTDARGRSSAGTLQIKRPGRVRFQYGSGDLLLVADGSRLWFLDYTVGQKSSYALNRTPLGLLLSSNPDVRSAKILPSADPRVITVRASRAAYGTLILVFTRNASAPGGLSLYGWTAIDAQNKRTTVKLSNVRYNVAVPASAFTFRDPKKR